MTVDEQMRLWRAGNPVYNRDRDECCPDFSCCDASLLVSQHERDTFCEASEQVRDKMLMGFLGRMLAKSTDRVIHIAGSIEGTA